MDEPKECSITDGDQQIHFRFNPFHYSRKMCNRFFDLRITYSETLPFTFPNCGHDPMSFQPHTLFIPFLPGIQIRLRLTFTSMKVTAQKFINISLTINHTVSVHLIRSNLDFALMIRLLNFKVISNQMGFGCLQVVQPLYCAKARTIRHYRLRKIGAYSIPFYPRGCREPPRLHCTIQSIEVKLFEKSQGFPVWCSVRCNC